MISFVIPTRDRIRRLRGTLEALAQLGPCDSVGGAEVIVVDNDSRERLVLPASLRSGVPIKSIWLDTNLGAAARNIAAHAASPHSQWLIMLDDDSWPVGPGLFDALLDQPSSVAVVTADIFVPGPCPAGNEPSLSTPVRERGGLPEVLIGCGAAIRTRAFLDAGGYDESFHYYVEEYDLCAKLLLAGHRVRFDPRFMVVHAKDGANRDMHTIVQRLVRNNAWVAQRYCPDADLARELAEVRDRYRTIARKEKAIKGYRTGMREVQATLSQQPRTPMPQPLWDRFTGLAAARTALRTQVLRGNLSTIAIIDEGKNAWVVARALDELGVRVVRLSPGIDVSDDRLREHDVQAVALGTMSPGPMLDAYFARTSGPKSLTLPVLLPWMVGELPVVGEVEVERAA
jgi:hypothetical protein